MSEKVLTLSRLLAEGLMQEFFGGVLCFGHFNSIHPGHLRYFQTARELGSPLVVAIEGDKDLLDIERSQYFSQEDRATSVAALSLVDHVVIVNERSLEVLVQNVDFQAIVFGKEFETLRAKKVERTVAVASEKGTRVVYDAGETHYSDARLLSSTLNQLEQENWEQFKQAQKAQDVKLSKVFERMQSGSNPKILVLGDTIVDRYVACDPIGMSNEAPVVVVKEIDNRDYIGGAGIVASHAASLGANCTYMSVTGDDAAATFARNALENSGVKPILFSDLARPTTFKIRYMVENQKLFRVSRLKEHSLARDIERQLIETLEKTAKHYDGIVVSDFVYGVVTPAILKTVRTVASRYSIPLYGDLQCSSQVGNILKFSDFSVICPTEKEVRIALGNQEDSIEFLANLLIDQTRCANLILKMGGAGLIAYEVDRATEEVISKQHYPALTVNPVDVTGAGDALIASLAVAMARGCSLMEAVAFSTCVSAVAVQTLGNRPVNLGDVRKLLLRMDTTKEDW